MHQIIRRLLPDETGATAIEYGLIAALISIAAAASMDELGESLRNVYNSVASNLNA